MSTKKSIFNSKKSAEETGDIYDNSKPFAPRIPIVNLIPQATYIKYAKEALIGRMIRIMIAVVTIFAIAWAGTLAYSTFIKNTNDSIVNEINGLQGQVGEVEPYQKYLDGIELVRQNMAKVFAKNIDMGIITGSLVSAAQAHGIDIKGLKITEALSTTEQNICVSSDAFKTTEQVGCITVTGIASSQQNVIDFFNTVTKTTGLVDSFISSIGSNSDGVVFSGTISISPELYTKRFEYLSTNIDDLLKEGVATEDISQIKPTPSPTATTKPTPTPTVEPTATPTPTPVKTP